MIFLNRAEAGKRLGQELLRKNINNPLVLAIPRGGAEIASNINKITGYEWDFYLAKKIGAPHNREMAIAAVDQTGNLILNEDIIDYIELPKGYMEKEKETKINEIKARLQKYRDGKGGSTLQGKNLILVDDGVATGTTAMAAASSLKKNNAGSVFLAVPVAPADVIPKLNKYFDEVICLATPYPFYAVGQFYKEFPQLEDYQVIDFYKKQFLKL